VGLQVFFRRRKPAARDAVSTVVVAGEPEPQEPLTPQQMAELQDAWDELAEAAKASEVTGVVVFRSRLHHFMRKYGLGAQDC
jgi:hypothetical protein